MRIIFILFSFFNAVYGYQTQLAVCAIFKDCAPYLKEWIEFHRMLGVEHFYLYDNSSADSPCDVLAGYMADGVVTRIDWPNRNQKEWKDTPIAWVHTTQIPAYNHALDRTRGKVKWIAFIDTDEFIVPVLHKNIKEFLNQHPNAPAIKLHWQVYGTSHVYSIPENRLMIELLTLKFRPERGINQHTKMIVRPELFAVFQGPHTGIFKNGQPAFTAAISEARINHYINRTIEFFYAHKIKGKETMDNTKWTPYTIKTWLERGNEVEDRIMDRFIPRLRKRMGFTRQGDRCE